MSEANTNPSPSPDVATLFSSLLSNPEALSKIKGILSKYASEENESNPPQSDGFDTVFNISNPTDQDNIEHNGGSSPTEQFFKNQDNLFDFSKIASLFGGANTPFKLPSKEQTALLLAIRPYLSPRRRELIDGFIKLSRLGVFFNKINQNGGSDVLQ